MKRTYTRTLMNSNLEIARIKVIEFENCKYISTDLGDEVEIRYDGLKSWDIIEGGKEAEEIEQDLSLDEQDEFHEYLVLHLTTGETATYRNSHVALFIF